jgi:hypothetical protein
MECEHSSLRKAFETENIITRRAVLCTARHSSNGNSFIYERSPSKHIYQATIGDDFLSEVATIGYIAIALHTQSIKKVEQKDNDIQEQGHPAYSFDLLESQSQKQNQD